MLLVEIMLNCSQFRCYQRKRLHISLSQTHWQTLVSHLFHTQFKAAFLEILHRLFPVIFTDLVPMLVSIEVTRQISIDFNWTGCLTFFSSGNETC